MDKIITIPLLFASVFATQPAIIHQPIERSIEQKIIDVFRADAQDAIAIAKCESSLIPTKINYGDKALNGHISVGLFQISMIHGKDKTKLLIPDYNIVKAKELFDQRGWKPWYNCAKKLNLL